MKMMIMKMMIMIIVDEDDEHDDDDDDSADGNDEKDCLSEHDLLNEEGETHQQIDLEEGGVRASDCRSVDSDEQGDDFDPDKAQGNASDKDGKEAMIDI